MRVISLDDPSNGSHFKFMYDLSDTPVSNGHLRKVFALRTGRDLSSEDARRRFSLWSSRISNRVRSRYGYQWMVGNDRCATPAEIDAEQLLVCLGEIVRRERPML